MLLDPEDLIDLDETLYDVKQEDLIGRDILPIKQDVPVWAESHKFNKYQVGEGQPSTVYHIGDDLPSVHINDRAPHSINIFEIALSYNISKKELKAAQATGVALEDENVRVLRRKFAEYENNIIFTGNQANGLCDFGSEYSMGDWETGTADTDAKTIYNNVDDMAIEFESQTGNWTARTAIFSKAAAKKAKTKRFDANQGGPGRSAWDAIQNADIFNNVYISDNITQEVMVLDNTPENMALVLPQDMQRLAPRDEGLYFEVPVWERLGEVLVRYDSSYGEDSYDAIMYANPTLA